MFSSKYQRALVERHLLLRPSSKYLRPSNGSRVLTQITDSGMGDLNLVCDYLVEAEETFSDIEKTMADDLDRTLRDHYKGNLYSDPYKEGLIEYLAKGNYQRVLIDLEYPDTKYPPEWVAAIRALCYERLGLQVVADLFWEQAATNPFQTQPMRELLLDVLEKHRQDN
jgi:hypothetical protein